MSRSARCACGRLTVTVDAEPAWVSTCHCDFCQRRTGSVVQVGAYYPADVGLEVTGETSVYNGLEVDGVGDVGGNSVSYHFCPTCGSTVFWVIDGPSASVAIAVGNFDDPDFDPPVMEFHTHTRHHWVPPVPGAEQVVE